MLLLVHGITFGSHNNSEKICQKEDRQIASHF